MTAACPALCDDRIVIRLGVERASMLKPVCAALNRLCPLIKLQYIDCVAEISEPVSGKERAQEYIDRLNADIRKMSFEEKLDYFAHINKERLNRGLQPILFNGGKNCDLFIDNGQTTTRQTDNSLPDFKRMKKAINKKGGKK
jgi:hypothetical protein